MATSKEQRQQFGPLVKSLRRAKGLTQRQVAVQLGIESATVSGWELAHFAPADFEMAMRLDVLLGADGSILDALGLRSSALDDLRAAFEKMNNELAALREDVKQLLPPQDGSVPREKPTRSNHP